jgi:50S ribosomal subunit-associated GTPase HflX
MDHFTPRSKQMSIHLQRFVDRVRGFEARGAREFTMSLQDAKDLHADITRLLIDLQTFREERAQKEQEQDVIKVEVDGGAF